MYLRLDSGLLSPIERVKMAVHLPSGTGIEIDDGAPKVVIFLSDDQFCIFFSKLVRDIDLILFLS